MKVQVRSIFNPNFMKFLLANILFKQNKWNSSISLFKSCIKNGFRVERSSQKMLYAYTKLGKVEEGSRFLINNILDEDFVLGMAFRFIKDWNNACTYLRKAYEQNPYSERIVDRYIRTLYDARYVSELIQLLKTKDIKHIESLGEENFLFLYKYCLNNGDNVQAEQILNLGFKFTKESGSGTLAFTLGKKLFADKKWKEAESVLIVAKTLGDRNAGNYIELVKNNEIMEKFYVVYQNDDITSLKQFLNELKSKNMSLLRNLLKIWCDDKEGTIIVTNKDKVCYQYAEEHIGNEPEFFNLQIALHAAINDEEAIRRCVETRMKQTNNVQEIYHTVAKTLRTQERYKLALKYALDALHLAKNNATIVRLVSELHHKLGNISESMYYLDQEYKLRNSEAIKKQIIRKRRFLEAEYNFSRGQLRPFADVGVDHQYEGIQNRVLHLHHNSVPYAGGGYAIRGQYIVKNLREQGVDAIIATRPGYPYDLGKGERVGSDQSYLVKDPNIDFPVYRLGQHLRWKGTPVDQYIDQYVAVLEKVVYDLKPGILHPASNFFNGIAAAYVAKKYNIPWIYEVRGLWELTRGSLTEGYEGSERYEYMKFLETTAMKQANHVVTISNGLKEEILRRGIPENKITVIPNAVDCSIFNPLDCNDELKDSLGLKGKTVIGFIGTLTAYEGLELLIKAFKQLTSGRDDIRVLIVGDGAISEQLKAAVENEQLQSKVIFTGRVPHEEVKEYYSIIDIFPFPRRNWPVCNIVTPLKPYEVMAMQKPLLVSDVGALKEMVIDRETGLYFKADNVEDLANKLLTLIDDPDYRNRLAYNSRKWVLENRDWRKQAHRYIELYKQLV